jgi:hypothetical protein
MGGRHNWTRIMMAMIMIINRGRRPLAWAAREIGLV